MKKVLSIMLVLMIAFGVMGCSVQPETTEDTQPDVSEIVDKVYVYEKEGCGGDFTIEIKADGSFTYYEGFLSSYIGSGEWSYADGMLTLSEYVERIDLESGDINKVLVSYNFLVEKDTLIFVDKDTGNFRYVKVQDGEKFLAQT